MEEGKEQELVQSIIQKYTDKEGRFNFSRALLEMDNRIKTLEAAMTYIATVITNFEDKQGKQSLILPGDPMFPGTTIM